MRVNELLTWSKLERHNDHVQERRVLSESVKCFLQTLYSPFRPSLLTLINIVIMNKVIRLTDSGLKMNEY